jgi:hypothetical protein
MQLLDGVFNEFRASAITDRLTLANIQHLDGKKLLEVMTEAAIAKVQSSTSFVGIQAKRILDRTSWALGGGWGCWGTTIDGGKDPTAYVKPATPPTSQEFRGFGLPQKVKVRKYPNIEGTQATPILPWVDAETAQEIYDRYQVTPEPGETFWQVVQRRGLPIAITEGLKKALCLIAHGMPAIAVRGVACWHPKGETELWPVLAAFAGAGRKIYPFYDQDTNPKTVQNVTAQALKLGKAFDSLGSEVMFPDWLPSEGKGIDDAIAAHGSHWFEAVLSKAVSLKAYKKRTVTPRLLAAIERAKTLSQPADRITTGEYLPAFPPVEVGTITVVQAPTGSGKTTQIRAQIEEWKAKGGNVLVLYSLNSLGQQTAAACGLPHIHDRNLYQSIAETGGVVLCFDSLHKIPQNFLDRPLLLILDEANQGIEHLVNGGTLGDRQSEILQKFAEVATAAATSGAIILAEARVFPHTVDFVAKVSGCQRITRIDHTRTTERGKVSISKTGKASGLLREAMDSMADGEKIIWLSTSQRNTRLIAETLASCGRRAVRIDSDTNREGQFSNFFDNPDKWLEVHGGNFDCLILSPSCKTGVSITWPGFDRVFGYFPALDPDSALQMLARYRPPVPRSVFIPDRIMVFGDEAIGRPQQIRQRIALNRSLTVKAFHLDIAEAEDDRAAAVAAAAVDFYCASTALRGTQKAVAFDYLAAALTADGFEVEIVDRASNSELSQTLTMTREGIWRTDAAALAAAVPIETLAEAQKIRGSACSLVEELRARKRIAIEEFPGVDFNDAGLVYQALYSQYGKLRRGVLAQIDAESQEDLAQTLADGAAGLLRSGLTHRLSKRQFKALLLAESGVLGLASSEITCQNSDAALIAIQQFAVRYSREIRYYLHLTIEPESLDSKGRRTHTPIDIAGKLLKAIGLGLYPVSRRGKDRDRQYRVAPIIGGGSNNPAGQEAAWAVRRELLTAAQSKAAAAQTANDRTIETEAMAATAAPVSTTWNPTIGAAVAVGIGFGEFTQGILRKLPGVGHDRPCWVVELAGGLERFIWEICDLFPVEGVAT